MRRIFDWFINRGRKTAERDTTFWRFLLFSLCIANIGTTLIITVANPTGIHFFVDFLIYLFLVLFVFGFSTITIGFLLAILYIPIPRLFIGGIIFTGAINYYILSKSNIGDQFSLIITSVFLLSSILFGIILYILFHNNIHFIAKLAVVLIPAAVIVWMETSSVFLKSEIPAFSSIYSTLEVTPLTGESPAKAGDYSVHYFTYGSGHDKHRKEYGQDVDIISPAIDGSTYIEDWPRKRKLFWGFDETQLPLNGRVWMPEGEGKFPIVVISHGNHKMEYFSDAGYGYLGELLASRGIITVSLDLNFLNYSNWSGIPKKDMELRTWMILQHLLQIDSYNQTAGNPFFNKVDFNKIALIGHSRGGLASTMAVDFKKWFRDDPTIAGVEKFHIQSVIALAPTDRTVDGRVPTLFDTNYLVIHGAQDADVNSFRGDRQYSRVYFSDGSRKFKSSLYLAEANHSFFNSDWGVKDNSIPGGIFLNHKDTMDREKQREITKVYVSAFLETTLLGNSKYESLFRNYQYGMNWLPETFYLSQYENGQFEPMNPFRVNNSKDEFDNGVTVNATGFSTWEVMTAEDRRRNKKGYVAGVLQWEDEGKYEISLSDSYIDGLSREPNSFIISIANMARDLENPSSSPNLEIEFENDRGERVRIPLSNSMPIPAQVKVQSLKTPLFNELVRKGKFKEEEEPVFHMYEVPLHSLSHLNNQMKGQSIEKITLYFSNGPGKVMINNIGYISY